LKKKTNQKSYIETVAKPVHESKDSLVLPSQGEKISLKKGQEKALRIRRSSRLVAATIYSTLPPAPLGGVWFS
jgi:hypothetical protein